MAEDMIAQAVGSLRMILLIEERIVDMLVSGLRNLRQEVDRG